MLAFKISGFNYAYLCIIDKNILSIVPREIILDIPNGQWENIFNFKFSKTTRPFESSNWVLIALRDATM